MRYVSETRGFISGHHVRVALPGANCEFENAFFFNFLNLGERKDWPPLGAGIWDKIENYDVKF